MSTTSASAAQESAPARDVPATKSALRLESIDGLRGLACLMVLLYHSCDHFDKPAFPGFSIGRVQFSLTHLFAYGYGGVDLFFVLSGFCLAYPIVSRPSRAVNWKQYFVNRVRRIVPPYWAAMILFGAMSLLFRHFRLEPMFSHGILAWTGIKQVVYSFLLVSPSFNSSFWTLPLEWRWYFVLPVLIWLWRRIGAFGALICTLPISLLWVYVVAPGSFGRLMFFSTYLPVFLPLFGLGIWAAALASRPERPAGGLPRPSLALGGVLVSGLLVAAFTPLWASAFSAQGAVLRLVTWGPFCFFLVLAATEEGRFKRLLSWRPLVQVGLFSYSLYLIHEPFLRIAGALILPRHPSPILLVLCEVVLLPAALIGLAYLFFLSCEKPWLRRPVKKAIEAEQHGLTSQASPAA